MKEKPDENGRHLSIHEWGVLWVCSKRTQGILSFLNIVLALAEPSRHLRGDQWYQYPNVIWLRRK